MSNRLYAEGQLLVFITAEDKVRVEAFIQAHNLEVIRPSDRLFLLVRVPVGEEHNWIDRFAQANITAHLNGIKRPLRP